MKRLTRKQLSCTELKRYRNEEYNSSKNYQHLGLSGFARDEKRHGNFFDKQIKRRCK